jgi:CubicO group peptidase (beta-lactamase class C family)
MKLCSWALLMAAASAPFAALAQVAPAAQQQPSRAAAIDAIARVDAIFDELVRERRVPGLAYGIVKDGRLLHVRALGLRDAERGLPATPDTRFRIASMSKAFTAMASLKLRDAGKLSLDAPAETYVHRLKGWRYPTSDSPKITVRDLLHHSGGFVEDNPWGDRQQPLSEDGFSAMLDAGVAFANAPGIRMEYSNFGYALLGRIVGNVSGVRYQDYIGRQLLAPLGMRNSGYDIFANLGAERARGFRWQDETWVREPDMADGAFGAMGGGGDHRQRLLALGGVPALRLAGPRRRRCRAGRPRHRARDRPRLQFHRGAHAAAVARQRLSSGGQLRDGVERGRRLRPRPRGHAWRRLSGLWFYRHDAPRCRCGHLRLHQPQLYRRRPAGVARAAGAT